MMHTTELSAETLLQAYSNGYFPMPEPDGEVLWYRPDPRAIIPLDGFHTSRSLSRHMQRSSNDVIRVNSDFEATMRACANRDETWIQEDIIALYTTLHELGFAHSLEVWRGQDLIGGTYGVHIGGAFFAESMFHTQTNASKVAIHQLVEHLNANGFQLLECQFITPHLASLGAIEINDTDYINRLDKALHIKHIPLLRQSWSLSSRKT